MPSIRGLQLKDMIMTNMSSITTRSLLMVQHKKEACKTSSRLVSPEHSDSGCFWVDCFGSLQDSLPNLCGDPDDNNKTIESSSNIVEDDDDDSPSKVNFKGIGKRIGSFRHNRGSHEDPSVLSTSSSASLNLQRRRRQRSAPKSSREAISSSASVESEQQQWLRRSKSATKKKVASNNSRDETRDPSPSLDNNNYSSTFQHKRSFDRGDGKRESDDSHSPLFVDPPNIRQRRAKSVPLEKLLNSRKDRGGTNCNSTQPSARSFNRRIRSLTTRKSSLEGGLGDRSTHSNLNNITEEMNVEPFALKHDEVVTALIDDALQGSNDDDSLTSIEGKRTTTTSTNHGSPTRKKRQQGGMGSPNRKKIATPQWVRNRPRRLDERSVCSRGSGNSRVTNMKTSDFFHPKCVLHKEKGSRKDLLSNPPSAVGREASLEKLMEKLSLLSEIESGKYGKGADMLRSDAVAFTVPGIVGVDAVETRSILTIRMGFVSMNYGIVLQWDCASELAKQVVLVKMCRDDFLERNHIECSNSGSHTVFTESDMEEENSFVVSDDSRADPYPPRALKDDLNSSGVDQSYLSVSILNVKQLVPKCNHAHHKADHYTGFAWPWSRATDSAPSAAEANPSSPDHSNVQPYVRFVFGRNEHLTKSVKFNKGNITWNKRQRNSCVLPCPPEDQRWFTGQDDLIVEVRSRQNASDDFVAGGRFTPKSFFKDDTPSPHQKRGVPNDQLLAAVTVPLSSIFFDEEADSITPEGKTRSVLSRLSHCFKKHRPNTKDELSSTNITLPLPMKCCSHAPFGSISLRITMKTAATYRETSTLPAPSVKLPLSPPRKKALQTKVDASQQQAEGIELMPLTSLISSWVNDGSETDPKNKHKATMSRVVMWTKRYDPRTKKWSNLKSNVNGSIKRSRSFKKTTKKKEHDDKPILFQVVDRVMGKEEEQVQIQQQRISWKPATDVMQCAGRRINATVHQVRERKRSTGSWIDETMRQVQERKKSSRAKAERK